MIELMIVLVIVAILAAIALPSYRQYVLRSNRRAAQSKMMDIANWQEQYFFANRSYLALANNAGISAAGISMPSEVTDSYNCSVAPGGGTVPSFTITCDSQGGQANDINNRDLTLDNTGAKGADVGDW